MPRVKIGDIVEITTNEGYAYAQYTHKHQLYGALLRVFEGIYESRPSDLEEVVRHKVAFSCFFPLGTAVHRKIVSIVGNVPVPETLQQFPIFRSGTMDPSTRKVEVWWLWDGEREWRTGKLTPEQRAFPIRGTWTYPFLIERIESHWTPETDPTT